MIATSLAALTILVPAPKNDLPPNPLRGARAGDWVKYSMVVNLQGMKIEGRVRMTLTALTDKEATVETTASLNGMETPAQKQTMDLTKIGEPGLLAQLSQNNPNAKIEKLAEGREKVTHRGKEFECAWVTVKVDAPGGVGSQELKLWAHKDAPLFGVLKMEMRAKEPAVSVTLEVAGSGRK